MLFQAVMKFLSRSKFCSLGNRSIEIAVYKKKFKEIVQCLFKATGISQPVDERIVKKIRILVGEGVNNVREMGRHIRQCVKNELFLGQELPPCTNRRFHPKQVDIRNHMYLATIESRFLNLIRKTCLPKLVIGKRSMPKTTSSTGLTKRDASQ
jgi:hypothetical protein